MTDAVEGITHAQLDQNHVVPSIGPIVVRDVWFPNQSFSGNVCFRPGADL